MQNAPPKKHNEPSPRTPCTAISVLVSAMNNALLFYSTFLLIEQSYMITSSLLQIVPLGTGLSKMKLNNSVKNTKKVERKVQSIGK